MYGEVPRNGAILLVYAAQTLNGL